MQGESAMQSLMHGALQHGTEATKQTVAEAAIGVGWRARLLSITSAENLSQSKLVPSGYAGLAR